MLLLSWLAISNSGCAALKIVKADVPDVPICRALHTRPETKDVPDIGKVTLQRPNPACMKNIGEPYCGYCVYTLTDKGVYIGNEWNHLLPLKGKKKTWDTVVQEALVLPAESQADIKAFGINVCKISGQCAQEIDRLRIKLDSLDSVGEAFKK